MPVYELLSCSLQIHRQEIVLTSESLKTAEHTADLTINCRKLMRRIDVEMILILGLSLKQHFMGLTCYTKQTFVLSLMLNMCFNNLQNWKITQSLLQT